MSPPRAIADHINQEGEDFVTTVSGLPAHALLVHFIVILAPLTAVLAITSAVWPAARKRLVWLILGLAVTTVVLTPLTTGAGEWLEDQVGRSPTLHEHTELGDTMIYFAIAMLIVAALLALIHVREHRGKPLNSAMSWALAAIIIVFSVATSVQVYRIGDSGARATWSNVGSAKSG
jgi:ABC-type Na+ efflux pump permease subunit